MKLVSFDRIGRVAVGLWAAVILFSGCGGTQTAPRETQLPEDAGNAKEESAVVPPGAAEEAPEYIRASEEFDNLRTEDPGIPVYDAYTLEERRGKGMATALPAVPPYREKKVAYLTFDDGPDEVNTPAILDILREEKVRGTFYVLGRNVLAYPEVTKRIFAEHHAIGNHSYDHDYDTLYASPEGYLEEMEKADGAIYSVIGMRPLITRAPGGRMGHFTEEYSAAMEANGYVEHDWNVSSADTAPNHPVAQDFIDNIEAQAVMDSAIILMHCSAGHEETVKALPRIIQLLKERGYSFGVVTPMTPQPW